MIKNGLRIFYDDFSEKVKNIHDEMENHILIKKRVKFKAGNTVKLQ